MERRRLMMAQQTNSGCPYIEDGLVFWLDYECGIAGTFYDHIGNSISNHGAVLIDNYYNFNRTYMQVLNNISIPKTIGTICASYVDLIGSVAYNTIFTDTGGSLELENVKNNSLMRDAILFSEGYSEHYKYTPLGSNVISACICDDYALINGEQKQKITPYGNAYTSAYPIIGEINQQGSGGHFRLYSLLIYNRKLSISEMLHNQQVDNTRFNLGL